MTTYIITPKEPVITVEYEELDGSPQEAYDSNGFHATRTIMCNWAERHTLAQQLKGSQQTYGSNIMSTMPAKYPHYPRARVKEVEIRGDGQPEIEGATKLYEKAVLTVQYGIYELEEETLVEESIEPSAEFLTLPNKNLYWGYGENKVALAEAEAPGFLISMADWVYTLKYQKDPPEWLSYIEGKTNDAPVKSKSLNRTFPTETLLGGRPNLSRTITTFGEKAWTVTVRFTYRNIEWNRFPRTDMATAYGIPFEPITNGYNIVKFFPPIDYGQIIR